MSVSGQLNSDQADSYRQQGSSENFRKRRVKSTLEAERLNSHFATLSRAHFGKKLPLATFRLSETRFSPGSSKIHTPVRPTFEYFQLPSSGKPAKFFPRLSRIFLNFDHSFWKETLRSSTIYDSSMFPVDVS